MIPNSWSELTWQQLRLCWEVKMRYGGNPDVARAAAWLSLSGFSVCRGSATTISETTGETCYTLQDHDGKRWTVTAREAAQLASQSLPWFDYPYGDPGEKEEVDDKGKMVKPRREAVSGYVSGFRDAMVLPETEVTVDGAVFALPQVACNNITWQQYRSLQNIVPQLFSDSLDDEQVIDLHAQFLAHILVPAQQNEVGSDPFCPKLSFRYNAERAEQTIPFWRERLKNEELRMKNEESANFSLSTLHFSLSLFHICFQVYHTAILYYERSCPLLFTGGGKSQEFRDALQGEVGTVNSVMKYQGYSDPQQVYDANLPIILDTLNTMAKEAKEIEKMNAKMKKK